MYDLYKQARDVAWQVLLQCRISRLPVQLTKVADCLGVNLVPYSQASRYPAARLSAISGDGFTALIGGAPVIFYNDQANRRRQRFTVAHELGHIALGHALDTIVTRSTEDSTDPKETAANIFARDLLAPACVLAALDVHTPEEIMALCGLSRRSAEIRAERMAELYRRGRFGAHPLERQVMEQFRAFCEATQKPR